MFVHTGIPREPPRGTYGKLAARSGMAIKYGISVGGGITDADYTCEINVLLQDHGNTSY